MRTPTEPKSAMETPKDGGILSAWRMGQQPREGDRHPEMYHCISLASHAAHVYSTKSSFSLNEQDKSGPNTYLAVLSAYLFAFPPRM